MYKYKYKAKTNSEWLYEAEIGAENGMQLRNLFFFAVCWFVGEDFELSDIAQNLHRCGFKTGEQSGERRRG